MASRLWLGTLAGAVVLLAALAVAPPFDEPPPPARAAGGSAPLATATPTPVCGQGSWVGRAPYPFPVFDHALTSLNGQLYSFGGNYPHGSAAYRYDPIVDTWTPLADLPAPRGGAGVVTDGRYAYIVGGIDNQDRIQNTLYRYDPVSDSYTSLAFSPLGSADAAVVYLDDRIYRVGGLSGSYRSIQSSVDVYDVQSNTWAPVGTIADYPVAAHGLQAIAWDGYIYGAGGWGGVLGELFNTYRYDPATNQWSDSPISDLPDPRINAASAVLNGRWILATGRSWNVPSQTAAALDLQDPTGPWATLPRAWYFRQLAQGATAAGGFYLVGGIDTMYAQADVLEYQETPCPLPSTTPAPTASPMPSPSPTSTPTALPCGSAGWFPEAPYPVTVDSQATAAQGGRIYSFGGLLGEGGGTDAAYVYDPDTTLWQALALMPQDRFDASAVSDGRYVYILNGLTTGFTNTFLRYDPVLGTYAYIAPAPLATAYQAAVYLDGKIYRLGGTTTSGPTTSVDVYTIATDTWAPPGTIAPYPLAVNFPAAVATGGYIYAAGGFPGDGGPPIAKTYRYDLTTNLWSDTAVADLPAPRAWAEGGLSGSQWVLGSGTDNLDWQPLTTAVLLNLSVPGACWTTVPGPVPARMHGGGAGTSAGVFAVGGLALTGDQNVTQRYREGACPDGSPTPTATAALPSPTRSASLTTTPSPRPAPRPLLRRLRRARAPRRRFPRHRGARRRRPKPRRARRPAPTRPLHPRLPRLPRPEAAQAPLPSRPAHPPVRRLPNVERCSSMCKLRTTSTGPCSTWPAVKWSQATRTAPTVHMSRPPAANSLKSWFWLLRCPS